MDEGRVLGVEVRPLCQVRQRPLQTVLRMMRFVCVLASAWALVVCFVIGGLIGEAFKNGYARGVTMLIAGGIGALIVLALVIALWGDYHYDEHMRNREHELRQKR